MKSIFEYLLSKSKSKSTSNVERPTKDSSLKDILDWVKSYNIEEESYGEMKPGEVVYNCINYAAEVNKKHNFVNVISCTNINAHQCTMIYPALNYGIFTDVHGNQHRLSFEEAIDYMEQIMMNPKIILKHK